jgi:hypothetical protein
MNSFTIDIDNNITANLSPQDAEATAGAEQFTSQARLAKLAATWPAERLVGIWNGIPGVTPTKNALPSPASAEGCPFLFGRFNGTTAQSDFS